MAIMTAYHSQHLDWRNKHFTWFGESVNGFLAQVAPDATIQPLKQIPVTTLMIRCIITCHTDSWYHIRHQTPVTTHSRIPKVE